MKKTNILLFLGLALVGCSNDEFEPASPVLQSMPDVAVDADAGSAVTKADLQNVVSIFGNGSKENRGRSQSDKDYTLSTIYDSEGSPAIYVINYADNGGFVLVSATKDYHPILAYAERGNYDVSRFMSSGLDVWEESTINAVKESASLPEKEKAVNNIEWLKYSAKSNAPVLRGPGPHEYLTDEEYEELISLYKDAIWELRNDQYEIHYYGSWGGVLEDSEIQYAESVAQNVYWMYEDIWQEFATLVCYENGEDCETPITVQSTWYQYDGYNDAYPILSNNKHAYAGCGPLAAGQIMRYFEYPLEYDWRKMPLHNPTYETSSFLYEIAEMADATYNITGTPASTENIRKVFLSKGYTSGPKERAYVEDMANSLIAGSPVFVEGWTDSGNGHAWVASQVKYRKHESIVDVYNFVGKKKFGSIRTVKTKKSIYNYYFYYNWGWKGNSNGYFLMDGSTYNKNMYVLLNIKPK